jgi:hypothetical protein
VTNIDLVVAILISLVQSLTVLQVAVKQVFISVQKPSGFFGSGFAKEETEGEGFVGGTIVVFVVTSPVTFK